MITSPLQPNIVTECIATSLYFHTLFATLPTEIQLVWKRGLTTASVIFGINRYVGLIYCAAAIWFAAYRRDPSSLGSDSPTISSTVCNWSFHLLIVSRLIIYLCVAIFTALRLYALTNKSKIVLIMVLLVGSISSVMSLWIIIFDVGELAFTGSYYQCIALDRRGLTTPIKSSDKAKSLLLPLISSLVTILLETGILLMTWRKAVNIKQTLRSKGTHVGLSYVLLRDGTLLYIAMIIESVLGIPQIPWVAVNLYSLADVLVSLCLSYFILNLRSIYLPSETETTLAISQPIKFNLSYAVGNFGAPINHGCLSDPWDDSVSLDSGANSEDNIHEARDPMAAGILLDFGHLPEGSRGLV